MTIRFQFRSVAANLKAISFFLRFHVKLVKAWDVSKPLRAVEFTKLRGFQFENE